MAENFHVSVYNLIYFEWERHIPYLETTPTNQNKFVTDVRDRHEIS